MSFTRTVVEGAFRVDPRPGPILIESLALAAVSVHGRAPTLDETRLASRQRRSLFNAVLEKQDNLVRNGGTKTFEVRDSSLLSLAWISAGQVTLHDLRIRSRAASTRWVDQLNDRQYEFLAAVMLEILGANEFLVTEHGSEYGIDFFGRIPAFSKSKIFLSGSSGLRIVGQSKKYTSPVSRDRVQAFNSTLDSVRHNRAEFRSLVPAWFRASSSPIVGCFISHTGFQSGAAEMCRQNGYVTLDTLQVSEIISAPKIHSYCQTSGEIQKSLWLRLNRAIASN